MARTFVQGIRLDKVYLTPNAEKQKQKVAGSYAIISDKGIEIAKQTFNGYEEIEVNMTVETQKAMNAFLEGMRKDINLTIGIEEE